MATTSISNSTSSNTTTCSTPECAAIAKSIAADLNLNVNPCSDFYQYTCGNWIANTTIPEDRVSAGTLQTAQDINVEIMRSILEGTYEDAYKSLFSTDEGFHRQDQEAVDKKNFNMMQTYYNVCLNEDQIDSEGPTPLYQNVVDLENVLFPVENEMQVFSKNETPLLSQTLAKLYEISIYSLNTFIISPDDKNTEINAILLDQVALGLPSKEYYEDPETMTKYKTGLNDILTKTVGQYSNGTQDATLRDTQSKKYNFTRWSNEKVAAAVDRFIDFETKLANISLKEEEMQDPIKLYNPIKVSDFQAQNSMIDWTSILQALMPNGIQVPDTVINRAPPYFERLNTLLASGNVTVQTLQEYCIITFVTQMIYSLDRTSREAQRKMDGEISSGISAERPRWETCTDYTSSTFSNILGRYYVLKKFGSENERMKVETFLTSIQEAWLHRLSDIDWLDNQTKSRAIEKLNLVKHKVAYSIVSPDLRQPISIQKFYQGISINETSFYDTEYISNLWHTRKRWSEAGQEVDKEKWYMSAQTVNAYYTPNGNEIVMPAGILQSPLYSANNPDYLNYGGIGMIIGHEITHAFDSSGRKYDGHGSLTDWWTNTTAATFNEKTQCFIDQYSKFNVSGPGNTTLNVNGKLTLGENLADNGGVAASLAAYKSLDKQEGRLPGLEHLTPEALFFINFARAWCGKQRDEIAQRSIYVDPHSPTSARVNGVIQNSAEFAQAFNCPAGSPMNPQTKCDMW